MLVILETEEGNITNISGDETLAQSNPFRYRGYYQDNESGFFYLQSRYYDSVVGRFLNADLHEILILTSLLGDVLGFNMFVYSLNSPVMYYDYTGYFAMRADLIADAIDLIIF